MKSKNLIIVAIAIIMAFTTLEVCADVSVNTKAEVQHYIHPKKGKIAKWKANKIKRHLIKREMKIRGVRPRQRK